MFLKITSPDKTIFENEVEKVILPTEAGEIGILPDHTPLATIVKPGIVKITMEKSKLDQLEKTEGLIVDENDIFLSISKGILFVDGSSITVTASSATMLPENSEEELLKMKENIENEIEKINQKGNTEELEKTIISLQKITADLKLLKLKNTVK